MTESIAPVSLDTFAETNAAFCALILAVYVSKYMNTVKRPMPITLIPLVLPIVMSGDFGAFFSHLTEDSTFTRWLSRTPQVLSAWPRGSKLGWKRHASHSSSLYTTAFLKWTIALMLLYSANAEKQLKKLRVCTNVIQCATP